MKTKQSDRQAGARDVGHAGQSITLSKSVPAWTILAGAFLSVVLLARAGSFDAPPGEPPVMMLLFAAGPPLMFYLAHRFSPRLQGWVRALDLAEITAMQSWRIIGAAFLFAWATQLLPHVFALPAGVGDIAVGIAAPAAALAIARGLPNANAAAWGIVFAGMGDFLVVVSIGLTARHGLPLHLPGQLSTDAMGQYPYVLFPAYLVPMFIILHIIAVIKLLDR